MDKEAIRASVRYQAMAEQHFNGGYFSNAVREQGEKFKTLSEEQKREFYKNTFNTVYEIAQRVQTDPRFADNEIDLSEHGLGVVTVSTKEEVAAEEEDGFKNPAHRSVMATSNAFDPTPVRESVWIYNPGDDLGLETNSPTMVQRDQEPANWGDYIWAYPDGSFYDTDNYFGELDINIEIMRLLDAKETLDLVAASLSIN